MKKYNLQEFKAIVETVLVCCATDNTFADNVNNFINGDIDSSFYIALNWSNDDDTNILECEASLSSILGVKFEVFTDECIDRMYNRYLRI